MKRMFVLALSGAIAVSTAAVAQNPHDSQAQHPQQQSNRKEQDHVSYRQNGKEQQFHKGEKLPSQFRGKEHYVTDYHRYHLNPPQKGYRWVRDDNGSLVLVAITTGVIAQILSGAE